MDYDTVIPNRLTPLSSAINQRSTGHCPVVPSGWLKAAVLHVLNQLTGHFPLVSPTTGTQGLTAGWVALCSIPSTSHQPS